MKIDSKTPLAALLDGHEELAQVLDWYGVDLTPQDRRSTVEEFCERYGLELEQLLYDLRSADASDFQ